MVEVEAFATHEEAMARLEEARKAADARVKPWQAQRAVRYAAAICRHGHAGIQVEMTNRGSRLPGSVVRIMGCEGGIDAHPPEAEAVG